MSARKNLVTLGFVLMLSMTATFADLIANSVADYSGVQGQGGWYYGFYTTQFTSSTFTEYNAYNLDAWHAWAAVSPLDAGGSFITAEQAVAGRTGSTNIDAVRRWVSTFAGEITIAGVIQKVEGGTEPWDNGGIIDIYNNGNIIYELYIAGSDTSVKTYEITTVVAVGTVIDFGVNCYYNMGRDRYDFTAQIIPEPATMVLLGLGGVFALRRKYCKFTL